MRRADLLDVTVEVDDERIRVRAVGAICLASLPMLRGVLDELLALDPAPMVEIDLGGATLLGCLGVDVLESTAVLLNAAGGELRVTNASGWVRRVIELLDADWLVAGAPAAAAPHRRR